MEEDEEEKLKGEVRTIDAIPKKEFDSRFSSKTALLIANGDFEELRFLISACFCSHRAISPKTTDLLAERLILMDDPEAQSVGLYLLKELGTAEAARKVSEAKMATPMLENELSYAVKRLIG